MKKRLDYKEIAPKVLQLMINSEEYMQESKLDKKLLELVKIRASQINGCAFCLDMHTKDARKLGEKEKRIYGLNAWRENDFYSKEEEAALALTEALTEISTREISKEFFDQVKKHFSDKDFIDLVHAINNINSWNRMNILLSEKVAPEIF